MGFLSSLVCNCFSNFGDMIDISIIIAPLCTLSTKSQLHIHKEVASVKSLLLISAIQLFQRPVLFKIMIRPLEIKVG